ncbi:hypothetical protein MPER_03108 [Moniliophthora perniciosa FA553]|nr:hypothetical protein MPER_03108 [Moniliophthora perniciosa FA553]
MRLKGRTSNLLDQSNWALFVNGTNLHVGYFCANAGFNGCLTLILAGRIWWMGRQGRESLGLGTGQRYRAVAAIILESGMMYPIILIVQAILTEKTDTIGVPIDFTPIATREEPPAPANGPGSNASTGAWHRYLQ